LTGANHLSKDNNNKTALDIATGPMRRLLLKNCGNVQVASAAAVALAAKAEAEFLAELEAEALVAQQLQPRRKGKRGKKKEQQPQSQPQPKLKTKTAVIVKQKATTAPVKLIQPVVPRVLCEIAVKLNHTELLSQASKQSLAVPLQECGRRPVASLRPAPISTFDMHCAVPACTVLENSTQTPEESEHRRSMQQLRMELEAAHQTSMMHLRMQLESSIQEHQSSMQHLTSQHQSSMQQQSKLAQQEIDQLLAKTECAVCLDGERDAVLFPCMHASCCHKCSASLEQCPQCRSPVTKMLRIYSP